MKLFLDFIFEQKKLSFLSNLPILSILTIVFGSRKSPGNQLLWLFDVKNLDIFSLVLDVTIRANSFSPAARRLFLVCTEAPLLLERRQQCCDFFYISPVKESHSLCLLSFRSEHSFQLYSVPLLEGGSRRSHSCF